MDSNTDTLRMFDILVTVATCALDLWAKCKKSDSQSGKGNGNGVGSGESCWFSYFGVQIKDLIVIESLKGKWISERK